MKRINVGVNFFVLLVGLCAYMSLSAQPPQKMSYQAVVRNANNELVVNQQIGIRMTIRQNSPTGPSVYIETHQATTNANGLMSIEVGNGTPTPGSIFQDINWGEHSYFLESEIDLAGGSNYTIQGTQQLITVPYAFYSETAGKVASITDGNQLGDILYWNPADSSWHIVPVGNSGQVLTLNTNGIPQWQHSAGGQAGTPPTVVTDSIFELTARNVKVKGTVIDAGSSNVIASGVCWGTSPYPSLSNNPTTDGSSIGSYVSSLNGLSMGTLYYARAYATNSAGTGYGDPISFTTLNHCGTVTDYEGNVYQTIYIGNQCWMKENLKSKKYTTGTSIGKGIATTSSSYPYENNRYYFIYNEDTSLISRNGLLYTFGAAIYGNTPNNNNPSGIQGVCPLGWHLPSLVEWCELENCVEPGTNVYCTNIGDIGGFAQQLSLPMYWQSSTTNPLNPGYWQTDSTNFNTTEFSAIPSGRYRYYKYSSPWAGFENLDRIVYWWTSTTVTISSKEYVYFVSISYVKPGIYVDTMLKSASDGENYYAHSVRCVKNY